MSEREQMLQNLYAMYAETRTSEGGIPKSYEEWFKDQQEWEEWKGELQPDS